MFKTASATFGVCLLLSADARAEPVALSGQALSEMIGGAVVVLDTPLGTKLPITYGEDGRMEVNKPSRVFTAEEVPVPGFLFDDPAVRKELALYYSSVRRADDSLGQILRALRESGEEDRTLIFFLSDHGMPQIGRAHV